jgi:hypothetical protein
VTGSELEERFLEAVAEADLPRPVAVLRFTWSQVADGSATKTLRRLL